MISDSISQTNIKVLTRAHFMANYIDTQYLYRVKSFYFTHALNKENWITKGRADDVVVFALLQIKNPQFIIFENCEDLARNLTRVMVVHPSRC